MKFSFYKSLAACFLSLALPAALALASGKMEVEPGGEWSLIMHGPDGTDYKNKSIFTEVIKHKKLVYEHQSIYQIIAECI